MSLPLTTQDRPPIIITHALPFDFPSLAAILPLANASNPIGRFMFQPDASGGITVPSQQWALKQFQNGQDSHLTPGGPMTHILKAMPEGSQEAVGFAIIRVFGRERADRNRDEGAEVSGAKGVDIDGGDLEVRDSSVDGLNHEFCEVWLKRMKDVYEGCVGGKNHAYWSTLMVLPAWQGRGVGSSIICWALENLHLDSMPTFLNAQPDGYSLYKKLGWKDIEPVDIDLSEWAGPNKGYGMHRTVCMLRDPATVS